MLARKYLFTIVKVVSESSATIPAIFALGLDSDHFQLNKFAKAEDGNYKRVSESIHRIAAMGPALVAANRRQGKNPRLSTFIADYRRVPHLVEPLSSSTTIESLLDTASKISRTVATLAELHNSPNLLQALLNDLSELRTILQMVERFSITVHPVPFSLQVA